MQEFKMLKGIGPKTVEYLNKLDVYSIDDLIHYYPFRYNILERSDIHHLKEDNKITIDGIIDSAPRLFRFRGNMNNISFRMNVNKMLVNIVLFNRGFLYNHLTPGKIITVVGKYDKTTNTITVSDIYFSGLGKEPIIDPVYYTTAGLNRKNLKKYIIDALHLGRAEIDYIPNYIVEQNHFIAKKDAIHMIHQPANIHDLKKAMLRLKYEELFLFMLKVEYLKEQHKDEKKGISKKIDVPKIKKLMSSLPFELTQDQVDAIADILADLNSHKRMNRLLQGDVGSGKTVVSFVAMYAVYTAGFQSAFMVPTEILAKQHCANMIKLFDNLHVNVKLLTASMNKKEKQEIYEGLKNGSIDMVVGTHAIIQDGVEFKNLGLVITDEQHRFGVRERNNLRNKGELPDVLYMSATPIPRTYALTIYGDMDLSNIKMVPKGKKNIITTIVKPNDLKTMLLQVKDQLDFGHQVYVVAPLVEESEKIDLTDVNKLKHQFELAFKSKYKVDLVHGKMKTKDKDEVMDKFGKNEVQILISTTVIEVGVDVKNATLMVIFDADRFGLSTLHQLRGRVGRNDLQSYCILITDKERERLKILTETNDGFEISEADFKLRGQGDLFGVRQSGDMNFKIADIKHDFKILLKAKEDAEQFMKHQFLEKFSHIKNEIERSMKLY